MNKSIIIICIISLLFIAGCNSKDKSGKVEFFYMWSKSTGLCYSVSNIESISKDKIISVNYDYFDNRAMVCVPCDSLKNVLVEELP